MSPSIAFILWDLGIRESRERGVKDPFKRREDHG